MTAPINPERTVYQVSELNALVRELLSKSFGLLWIEGELSNVARPRSGHVYFSLKDDAAQVRCALFRNKARRLSFEPQSGDQVLVRARVGLYAARGDYQLIVDTMEPAGAGALQRAFEQLKHKLDAEGLFAQQRKRSLPPVPKRIGVITSATGAALRDVLSVLARRYPLGEVRVYPVPVQGTAAPAAIISALERADERADCDVLLLVRGGGSLEDLQAFNDERVARRMAACTLPLISGVGHEVDFTIADFVADRRAPTPSAAAELVCPDLQAWARQMALHKQRLGDNLQRRLSMQRQRCDELQGRLARQHPRRQLEDAMQRFDDVDTRLRRALTARMTACRQNQAQLHARLRRAAPANRINRYQATRQQLSQRLQRATGEQLHAASRRLNLAARTLHAVSPLQTLERGYAIARTTEGDVLRSANHVHSGDRLSLTLHQGRLYCRVDKVVDCDSEWANPA